MPELTDRQNDLLMALDSRDLTIGDAVVASGGTTDYETYCEEFLGLMTLGMVALCRSAILRPDLYTLTHAGREWVAEHKAPLTEPPEHHLLPLRVRVLLALEESNRVRQDLSDELACNLYSDDAPWAPGKATAALFNKSIRDGDSCYELSAVGHAVAADLRATIEAVTAQQAREVAVLTAAVESAAYALLLYDGCPLSFAETQDRPGLTCELLSGGDEPDTCAVARNERTLVDCWRLHLMQCGERAVREGQAETKTEGGGGE